VLTPTHRSEGSVWIEDITASSTRTWNLRSLFVCPLNLTRCYLGLSARPSRFGISTRTRKTLWAILVQMWERPTFLAGFCCRRPCIAWYRRTTLYNSAPGFPSVNIVDRLGDRPELVADTVDEGLEALTPGVDTPIEPAFGRSPTGPRLAKYLSTVSTKSVGFNQPWSWVASTERT